MATLLRGTTTVLFLINASGSRKLGDAEGGEDSQALSIPSLQWTPPPPSAGPLWFGRACEWTSLHVMLRKTRIQIVENCLGHPNMVEGSYDDVCEEACHLWPSWESDITKQVKKLPPFCDDDLMEFGRTMRSACKVAVPNEKKCAVTHLYYIMNELSAGEEAFPPPELKPEGCPVYMEYLAKMEAERSNCNETDTNAQLILNIFPSLIEQMCADASSVPADPQVES